MAACVVLAAAATGGDRDVAEFLFKKAEKAYRAYLEMLGQQYALEKRWPEQTFWRRRHPHLP